MVQNRNSGAVLIVLGVLANNYVYLHDLLFGKYEHYEAGAIVLGWLAGLFLLVSLAMIGVGLVILMRSPSPPAAA